MLYTILATPFPQRNTKKEVTASERENGEKGSILPVEPEAQLTLTVITAGGRPLNEPVDVFLFNQTLTQPLRAHCPSTPATINGLYASPMGRYRIEVDAPCYDTVSQFVSIPADGDGTLTITMPVDASRVTGIKAPTFDELPPDAQRLLSSSSNVLNFEGKTGADLYNALDDVRRAGFLNLITKANSTRFQNERTVLSYITSLIELRGDRFFANTGRDLRSETTNAMSPPSLFHEVSEALHTPTAGFERDRSFKTFDLYGNLQLSFFKNDKDEYTVDMDIDDAQGFDHVFQVIRNIAGPTNPYNIHEILLATQHLDAGYELLVPESTATA